MRKPFYVLIAAVALGLFLGPFIGRLGPVDVIFLGGFLAGVTATALVTMWWPSNDRTNEPPDGGAVGRH